MTTLLLDQEIETDSSSIDLLLPDDLQTADHARFAPGGDVDWAELIDSDATLHGSLTLEQVQQYFRDNPGHKYAAVMDGPRILGLCSELAITRKLTLSRGLGYCVYARTPLKRHLEDFHLVIRRGEPVLEVLDRAMSRGTGFFDDIILTDVDGGFIGLIQARTMMLLQHRINRTQVARLENMASQLNDNNHELERARDATTQAAEMKSSFLANMSHEIRTPLNGVLGMLKILLRTPLEKSQRRYASTSLQSANALLAILNDILDFSKIEAGRMTFEKIPFDLSDVVEETVQLLSERAHEKKIELFSWTDLARSHRVVSDPSRIRQVLINLASNAVKFTEKGEVVLRVDIEEDSGGELSLKISVRDTGIGISDEVRERLFSAFEQGDRSTSRKFGGTGLGLAISKRIVSLLGGEIGCESTPGEGSTFWFRLRLPKDSSATATLPQRTEDELWGLRVLIVDDTPSFANYIEQHLARWKVVTRIATSTEEGFSLASGQASKGTPFDIIIADYHMEGTDGLELARRFNSAPGLDAGRIILLVSFEQEIDTAARRETGLASVLAKPVRPGDLYDTMLETLRLSHERRSHAFSAAMPLPVPQQAAITPAPPTNGAIPAAASEQGCPPMRLLLVEDSAVNREVGLIFLHSWGHTVDIAENGHQAVEMLSRQKYDAILMDCQMPEMDGYEATRTIRDHGSAVLDHGAHIIAMTANAMPGDRERCLETGMNDYVGKPIDEAELYAALTRATKAKASRPEPLPTDAATLVPSISPPPPPEPTRNEPPAVSEVEPFFPARLIRLFLEETEKRVRDLRDFQACGDRESLMRTAHTIKGTAGNFRATELFEVCRELEEATRNDDHDRFHPLVERAAEAFQKARDTFSPQLEPAGSPIT